MIETTKRVINGKFYFSYSPIYQLMDRKGTANLDSLKLKFDFDICGFCDDTVFFIIDDIIFNNIDDFLDGQSKVLLETNLEFTSETCDIVSSFIKDNNDSIVEIYGGDSESGMRVAFSDFYLYG